jgi:hypothetical protein
MDINYNLREEDYINFNVFYLKNSKTAIRSLNLQRYLAPVFFIIMSYVLSLAGDKPFVGLFITFLITSILWIVFFPKYFYSSVTRRIKKMIKLGEYVGFCGDHVLTITDEGIVESTSNGQTKVNWSGIIGFKEDSDYFYLFNSSGGAFIIPKRELTDVEEISNYLKPKVTA